MSHQSDMDNHADQLNPNNDAYWESRGCDELFQVYRDFTTQDLLPVLRYPHKVVFQVVNGMLCPSYTHADFIAGLLGFRNFYSFTDQISTAFIPPASWRVFSRRFL